MFSSRKSMKYNDTSANAPTHTHIQNIENQASKPFFKHLNVLLWPKGKMVIINMAKFYIKG